MRRTVLGVLLAAFLVSLAPVQAETPDTLAPAPVAAVATISGNCTPEYETGFFDKDKWCLDVAWKIQDDGKGIYVYWINVSPNDYTQYNNPSADIDALWVENNNGVILWSRTGTTTQSQHGRVFSVNQAVNMRCGHIHLRVAPKVKNWVDPGLLSLGQTHCS